MLDHTHQNTKPTIYAAIELSKKSWIVAILHSNKDQPSIHRVKGGDVSELIARLRGAAAHSERLLICYEAGYDGFWLARSLDRAGIDCRVLDPASLQVNRRARRVKTDRLDVLMLVRALVAVDRGDRHVCSIVRVTATRDFASCIELLRKVFLSRCAKPMSRAKDYLLIMPAMGFR